MTTNFVIPIATIQVKVYNTGVGMGGYITHGARSASSVRDWKKNTNRRIYRLVRMAIFERDYSAV
jgi:hypothetical protein